MIDLHIHTTYSDGGKTPEEILKNITDEDILVITDHNNCEASKKYKVIPGIEIEVKYHRKRLHFILYNFNLEKIKKYEDKIRNHDIKYFLKNCKSLGIKPSKNFLKNNVYFDKIRINNLLVEMNLAHDGKDAFYKYTKNLPDITRKAISLSEVFKIEKISGGILTLAHPYKYYQDINKTKKLILFLKNRYNLRAVECYSNHGTIKENEDLIKFCHKHSLLISGGSDYHAKYGEIENKELGYVNKKTLTKENLTILQEMLNKKL